MKSNGLLKWLMIPFVGLVTFVAIKLFSDTEGTSTASRSAERGGNTLTAEEAKALGIEGDTPKDTVATLVAQVKELRGELKATLDESKRQKGENERLRLRDSAIDQRIQTAITTERERWQQDRDRENVEQQQAQSLLDELQRKLETMGTKTGHSDLPVGLGLTDADAIDTGAVHWVEPQDARPANDKKPSARSSSGTSEFQFPTSFGSAADRTSEALESVSDGVSVTKRSLEQASSARPVYTVPSNSTLMGSVAMTALIGRIPVDGTVNDPFPFKVLIGADNLTANGVEVPDVAGAIVSGTASGDWTLSCVRGQIRSMTFVFHDGTIRTVDSDASGRSNAAATSQSLGWISDPHGIPCVSGARRSNARQYLTSQSLITAAGAGAASLIDADSGSFSYVSGSNGSLGTVGISGNEAMGRILANGVQDLSQWVNKLYGQAFAAVYVPPGAPVAIHLERPVEIDYENHGRKVNHQTGDIHAPDLD